MEIMTSTMPVLVRLDHDDISYLLMASDEFKRILKHTPLLDKAKKREKLRKLNRLIVMLELLL